jgi:hypothetical protein
MKKRSVKQNDYNEICYGTSNDVDEMKLEHKVLEQ